MELTTTASVRLVTGKGNIDIDLYAKEIPNACRHFLQNCLDERFVGLQFMRITPDLVEAPPKKQELKILREFHSRVRFSSRYSVAIPNVKDSQYACPDGFFITTKPLAELNNHFVIIGKVVGDSIYNVVKIHEAEKKDETPVFPVSITKCEILEPYFTDLLKSVSDVSTPEPQRKKQKTKVKLSYGDDEEEELEFVMKSAQELLPTSKKEKKNVSTEEAKKEEVEAAKDSAQVDNVNSSDDKSQGGNSSIAAHASGSDVDNEKELGGSEKLRVESELKIQEATQPPKQEQEEEQDQDEDNANDTSELESPEEEPTRDPAIDPYDPLLDVWKDTVTFEALQNHRYQCR